MSLALNAIELIDYGRDSIDMDHSHMIQSFHRFLMDHLSTESNAFPHNPSLISSPFSPPPGQEGMHQPAAAPVTQLLGLDGKNIMMCTYCQSVREKDNLTHVVDMIYPRKVRFYCRISSQVFLYRFLFCSGRPKRRDRLYVCSQRLLGPSTEPQSDLPVL